MKLLQKAEQLSGLERMMRLIAEADEHSRRFLLSQRIKMLLAMPEPMAVEALRDMISILAAMAEADRQRMVDTRTKLMAELSDEDQLKMVRLRANATNGLPPEAVNMDTAAMIKSMSQLPAEKRAAIMRAMDKVLFGV